ncbi:MAG: hypothetical protein E5X11_29680, partial [Mesorhizobium sp.]
MNPKLNTAAQITGAVAGTIPAMAAAPEAFGIGATTKLGKYAVPAITGGLMNGADSAVRSGGDLNKAGLGAGVGFATGLAAPFLAPLAGRGVKAIADKIQLNSIARALGLDKSATKVLAAAVRQDAV